VSIHERNEIQSFLIWSYKVTLCSVSLAQILPSVRRGRKAGAERGKRQLCKTALL
jgi:hypothetical protein